MIETAVVNELQSICYLYIGIVEQMRNRTQYMNVYTYFIFNWQKITKVSQGPIVACMAATKLDLINLCIKLSAFESLL